MRSPGEGFWFLLPSISIKYYRKREHSGRRKETLWIWDFKFSWTFTGGGHVLGSPSQASVLPQPGPQHQVPWDSSSGSQKAKASFYGERGGVLCVETKASLFWSQRPTGQEAKASQVSTTMQCSSEQLWPKMSFGNYQKESSWHWRRWLGSSSSTSCSHGRGNVGNLRPQILELELSLKASCV